MDANLLAEARRQVGNLRWGYGERRKKLPEFLASGRRDRAYARMLDLFRSASGDLLLIGQADQVLEADTRQARMTFREAADWLPFFEEVRQSATSTDLRLSINLMLEPIACLLLAGDREALAVISSVDETRAFIDPDKEPKAQRAWAHFMRELLLALRPETGASARRAPELLATDTFAGYERVLNAILAHDQGAFDAARSAAEAQYPARRTKRDSSLNWFGYGKLAQAATFDALGTALCALAVHKGLTVEVDSALYPRAYIHGAR